MKRNKSIILLPLALIVLTASCQAGLSEAEVQVTAAQLEFLDLVDTAVFETQVVILLTDWAPTATLTLTPSPTFTLTPEPSLTPTITETVYKNPWVLQDECLTEVPTPCVAYSIQNTEANSWVQVILVYQLTGEEGAFSIAPKSTGTITLMPGSYKSTYLGSCSGGAQSIVKIWDISARTNSFYCSTGGFFRMK
jgi:hypothetical protein